MHVLTRITFITPRACVIIATTQEEEIRMLQIVSTQIEKTMPKDFVKIVILNQKIKRKGVI